MSQIASVEVFRVEVPITRTFNFASGSAGAAGEKALVPFVKITDDEDNYGWSDARPTPSWNYETADSIMSTLTKYLAPAVIGTPVHDRWALHDRMRRVIGTGPSTGMPLAKSALDVAVHDLAARAAGLTVRSYLGGSDQRRSLPLSWTVTAHDAASAKDDISEALEGKFRHVNFKVGVQRDTDTDIAVLLRSAFPSGFVWADANQSLSLREARLVAEQLRAAGTDVLEQPLRADLAFQMRSLRQATLLPLAADESTVSAADFFALAKEDCVDYLIVKVSRSGGLAPTLQQIAIAQAAGIDLLVSGLCDTFLTKLAACQVAVAAGYQGPAGLNGSQFIDESELFPDKHSIEFEGMIHLNDEPGLGTAPDENALRRWATDAVFVS